MERYSSARLPGRTLIACLLVAPLFIYGGETDVTALPDIIVTATRRNTPIEKTATSATVITRQDLEEGQFTDAASALKTVPGLNLRDNGTPGQTVGVFMRGTESRHTVIMVDGHRLPTGAQRYFDLSFFPLVNLRAIEVVRGPLSSAQGGSAVGGAINFITNKGAGETPTGQVAAEYGSFDTRRFDIGASASKDGLYANVGGSYFATNGDRANSEFESSSTLNTIGYSISDTAKVELLTSYQNREGGNPGSLTSPSLTENQTQDLLLLAPSFTFKTGEQLTHAISYSYAEQNAEVTRSAYSDQELVVKTQGVVYQLDYAPSKTLALQSGVEANWQTLDTTPTGSNTALPFSRDEASKAVFSGATFSPIKHLTLVGSVRRDVYDDYYGSANTWRYGASYRIASTGTVVHASDGTAFAAPEVQNFIDYGYGPSATALAPERSRGQEFGVTQKVGADWDVGATVFWNEIHDLVQYVYPSARNVGLARTQGMETQATYRFAKTWSVRAAYTYLSARDEKNNKPLVRRPRQTASLEVRGELADGWLAGVAVRGIVQNFDGYPVARTENYVVVRVFTQYALRENLLLKLRVENLLDEDYAEVKGYPALPVGVHAGVEWKF